ncbi:hypothetical protein AB0G32_07470 [Streptomyces sp. NPDC023723]|uniref:hypothetical protein n=1 Tax=Streptomyces sp. NPDC023723 TaxID=3154323 RepID=UPI0033EBC3C2
MRLCASVMACPVAAAALLTGPAPAASAQAPAPLPACTAPDDHTFPLTTRVHGGPAAYAAGGGPGTWYLDLTNTTDRGCSGIHPVVVLTDARHALRPAQARLEFRDGDGRPRPVRFERTDADELVAVLDGFPGFTVEAGRTVRVELRLAFTPDTGPDEVTAAAAVVQRRAGDGEWIGQSQDYRFRVTADNVPSVTATATATAGSAAPSPPAHELAGTGRARTWTALALGALLVAAGTAAVLLARRHR